MKVRKIVFIAGIIVSGLAVGVAAQNTDGINFDSIQEKASSDAAALEDFVNRALKRGEVFQEEAQQITDASIEKIGNLEVETGGKAEAGVIDFDELVAGASALVKGGQGGAPLFMVFASTSMPPESLKPLIAHTAAAGGVVVFRGFPDNSAKQFMKKMQEVVGKNQTTARITIDPRLFRAFGVQRVPTFVVAGTDFEPCDQLDCVTLEPPADKMSGNVTVRYALGQFSNGGGAGARIAKVALRNLKDQSAK